MFKKIMFTAIISFSAINGIANAQEAPTKYATCAACHGADGVAVIDGYPNLAGQNKQYLVNAYKAYKNGERNGGNAEIMKTMANVLTTEAEIEEVAEWLSKQK
mgnify:CR=1 FL=1